jgi:sugar phosphate isomerase/epimerase
MFSRRDLGKAALGSLPIAVSAAKKMNSIFQCLQFGLQSYVFSWIGLPHETQLDVVIRSMVESSLGECDLYAPLVEPADLWDRIHAAPGGGRAAPEIAAGRARAREELAKWRRSVSPDHFRAIRKKFEDAGIVIYGLSGFPGDTEEEVRYTFDAASACGARLVSLQIGLAAARRAVPLAEKSDIILGIQGHPDMAATNPDAISRPENYRQALSFSDRYVMSFDIGDATGGGYDALQFVEEHHDRLALLYLKDKRKDKLSVPWGQGDTPIPQVLRLLRDRKYPIRCYIDCDHKTSDRPADVKRSFEYAKAALA